MSFKTLEVHFVRPNGRSSIESYSGDDLDRLIKDLVVYEENSNNLKLVASINDRPARVKLTTKLSTIVQKKAEKLTLIILKKRQKVSP